MDVGEPEAVGALGKLAEADGKAGADAGSGELGFFEAKLLGKVEECMVGVDGDGGAFVCSEGEDAVGVVGGEGAGGADAVAGDGDGAEGEETPGNGQAGGVVLDGGSAAAQVLHGDGKAVGADGGEEGSHG